MNFPLEYPIFQFFFWLVNTPGVGGLIVLMVGGGSLLAYGLVFLWISREGGEENTDTFSFPTPALHGEGEHE